MDKKPVEVPFPVAELSAVLDKMLEKPHWKAFMKLQEDLSNAETSGPDRKGHEKGL